MEPWGHAHLSYNITPIYTFQRLSRPRRCTKFVWGARTQCFFQRVRATKGLLRHASCGLVKSKDTINQQECSFLSLQGSILNIVVNQRQKSKCPSISFPYPIHGCEEDACIAQCFALLCSFLKTVIISDQATSCSHCNNPSCIVCCSASTTPLAAFMSLYQASKLNLYHSADSESRHQCSQDLHHPQNQRKHGPLTRHRILGPS